MSDSGSFHWQHATVRAIKVPPWKSKSDDLAQGTENLLDTKNIENICRPPPDLCRRSVTKSYPSQYWKKDPQIKFPFLLEKKKKLYHSFKF